MIILRFGTSGRLAGICRTATATAFPDWPAVALTRGGEFVRDDGADRYGSCDAVVDAHPDEQFLVIDASVDHGSSQALAVHESFKRDCIAALGRRALLWRCVGFSSGIAMVEAARIRSSAPHMLEYRRQKLLQEELFAAVACPVFLPRLFTLVGPRTFSGRAAAWAQVLQSRLGRADGVVLNEPHARKAWASEFEVFRRLLSFLAGERPESVTGPLVQGDFTLHEIASGRRLPLPPIAYTIGTTEGWLCGDYSPAAPFPESQDVTDELLRAIAATTP